MRVSGFQPAISRQSGPLRLDSWRSSTATPSMFSFCWSSRRWLDRKQKSSTWNTSYEMRTMRVSLSLYPSLVFKYATPALRWGASHINIKPKFKEEKHSSKIHMRLWSVVEKSSSTAEKASHTTLRLSSAFMFRQSTSRRKLNFTYVLGFVVLRDVVKVFQVRSPSFARKTTGRNRARSHSGAWRGWRRNGISNWAH